MKVSIKNIIIPSIPLAVILVGSCFVLWMSAFLGGRFGTLPTHNSFLIANLKTYLIPDTLLSNILSFVFTLLNAFLIAQINNRFTVIRTRTFLPIFIFLVLMSTWNETHIVNGSHISLTFIIFALFYFMNMFRDRKASEMAYMGSFFLSIASIIINPYLFLLPVSWIGFMIFQSFSLRTFLASVFGFLTPWILFLASYYLFYGDANFSQLLNFDFSVAFNFDYVLLYRVIFTAILIVIMIICIIGIFSTTNNDAIRTRNNINFLILMLISTFILALIFRSQFVSFLPFLALLFAMLSSHPFTLKQNNFFSILFIVFYLVNIAFIVLKYIPF